MVNSLNDLSAQPNTFINILSEHYLLIQQARVIKALQSELEQLKKIGKAQENNSSSFLGSLGIFGSSHSESNAVQVNEEDGINMDVFLCAFTLLNS